MGYQDKSFLSYFLIPADLSRTISCLLHHKVAVVAVIVSESVVWTEEESLLSGLGRHPLDLTQDSRPSCHPLCDAENRFF